MLFEQTDSLVLLAHDDRRRAAPKRRQLALPRIELLTKLCARHTQAVQKKIFLEGCSRIMPFDHYLHTPSNAAALALNLSWQTRASPTRFL